MLKLLPFSRADFAPLASWFSNQAEVTQWAGPALVYPLDAEQFEAMLADGHGNKPLRRCWMIAAQDNSTIGKGTIDKSTANRGAVGHAQIVYDWRQGNARLARVAVAPSERGKGRAQAMLEGVVAEAFSSPGIERLELNVYSFNAPAIRTYEKLGFVREGVRRSSVRVGAERWDTVIMGLLRSEWSPDRSKPGRTG